MPLESADVFEEKDATDKIIDLCRGIKDKYVRQIVLGLDFVSDYEKELKKLEKNLRTASIYREEMFNRIVNLVFAYIVSKYKALYKTVDFRAESNCEARIKHAADNLYSTYNVTDDVVRFVLLNIALGLDASESFRDKFDVLKKGGAFYSETKEYISVFRHIQKLRQSSFKKKGHMTESNDILYTLFKKFGFICDVEITDDGEYADADAKVIPCCFKVGDNFYPSKYALVRYSPNEYCDKFLLLRNIEELSNKKGPKVLRLNYTGLSDNDTSEAVKIFFSPEINPQADRELIILAPSTGKIYSYITGDLLRKRHRMSFCNGLSSYKYYGELAASVMDALEILVVAKDKQFAVVENYILPVIKNNFNICKEDCVCSGAGCKFGARNRLCNEDRVIESKDRLKADCVSNMDIVSILTILFSVVGCKEILPQLFAKFEYIGTQSYDELFSQVNRQLEKRFADFDSAEVEELRKEFYGESIKYLSLNLGEVDGDDGVVAQTLKPFKIRAYTDALVYSLENLDRDKTDHSVSPSENVYSIQNKIDLISGMSGIMDVRSALRDTLKIILTYYAGLANCTSQQLDYEIKAEQTSSLNAQAVKECREAIDFAFMQGVRGKLKVLGQSPTFYTLFRNLIDDTEEQKSEISIMLGREMVSLTPLGAFISMDDKNGKCYLVERRRKSGGGFEYVYRCDLDDEEQCRGERDKFIVRVIELLKFFKGDDAGGTRFACYPQVLTHTSSRVNVDKTTINAFTVYESEQYLPKKEYNVITYFSYEISKRYYYIAPKKFEKTRWITYPILIRCSKFYETVIKEGEKQ